MHKLLALGLLAAAPFAQQWNGEFFVRDAVPNGPALFRTRAACVKARKQRRDAK